MLRTAFAGAVAGLIVMALSGTAQSAPLAPLPPGITAHLADPTDVAWRRCWRDRWGACIAADAGVAAGAAYAAGDLRSFRLPG
jgi:hypothetical protein